MEPIRSLKPCRPDRPVAFLFPGQGSQAVGMGKDLLSVDGMARRTFEEADDVLGWSVTRLCLEGPESELVRTEKAQPALLTVSLAVHRAFMEEVGLAPAACLGHSLGEYSALVAADALSFEEALLCVQRRAEFMAAAVAEGEGGMAAVLGLDQQNIEKVCRETEDGGTLVVANFNAPGQLVISGHRRCLDRVEAQLIRAGALQIIPLSVSAPFHSPLMRPAAESLRQVLEQINFREARCSVLCNVTGEPHQGPETIRRRMVEQVASPVRWEQCVRWVLRQGIRDFLEIGPGRVLTGLLRRIDRSSRVFGVDRPEAIKGAAAFLQQERSG